MSKNLDDQLLDLEPMPEGEETPPPFVKTMGIVRWVLLIGMCLFASVMILGYFNLSPLASAEVKGVQYHCPMHPTYVSNQPGECPICGMNLVPITADSVDASKLPSEPMADTNVTPNTKAHPGQYYCPMDPDDVSDTAARCPICGMKLLLYEAKTGQEMNTSATSVPGLVEIALEPKRLQLIGLKTGRVEKRALGATISAFGYVAADESKITNVQLRSSGWVKKLFVDQTGQMVKVGDPILSIYSQDIYQAEQDYLSALEAAGHAVIDPSLTSVRSQVVDASKERLHLLGVGDKDIADIEKSHKPMTELVLSSSFSGIVIQKNVTSGQAVTPDQSLITLADLHTVWFLAEIYQQDAGNVHEGQLVDIEFPASGIKRNGKVAFIYPVLSNETRTVRIRVELSNADLVLRPGIYGKASLVTSSAQVLAVPADAILDGGKIKYAFVVHDKTHFVPRQVSVGQTSDDWMEVLAGLKDGDEVVTSANFLIDSESRLKAAITGMSGTSAETSEGHSH